MAWPTTGQAFFRNPEGIYKHDGFGHDRGHDAGVRPACFRTIPHSGLDFTGRGPILSVAGGYVVASEWSTGAGWALVEDVTVPGYGRVWLVYFHGAARMLPVGTITRWGQELGTIGDTGTGTSKGAYHLHLAAATSLRAALSLLRTGNFARYKGETSGQWAARMGLVDPLPVIRAALAAQSKPSNPAPAPNPQPVETPAQREEREVANAAQTIIDAVNGNTNAMLAILESRVRREARPVLTFVNRDESGKTYTLDTSPYVAAIHPASGFILPLNPPGADGKRGQVVSLQTNGYRIIAADDRGQGMEVATFFKNLGDIMRGARVTDPNTGEPLDPNAPEAVKVAAARALWA